MRRIHEGDHHGEEETAHARSDHLQVPRAEVKLAPGTAIAQVCKDLEVTEQTYYRLRKEYGGLKLDQAKRLKELWKENDRLDLERLTVA
jgi:hypothetical protein